MRLSSGDAWGVKLADMMLSADGHSLLGDSDNLCCTRLCKKFPAYRNKKTSWTSSVKCRTFISQYGAVSCSLETEV